MTMIDSLGVQFTGIKIDQEDLEDWEMFRQNKHKGFVVRYGLTVTLSNGATFQYTYYPYVLNGLFKVEFSLPHVVFGTNLHMVFNLKQAINIANQRLPDIPGVPPLDLWQGTLYRLDACYYYQMGDLVPWYIQSLQALEFPRRRTKPYTSRGVEYGNGNRTLRFYDKEQERRDKGDEAGAKLAHGILRLEVELRKRAINRLAKKFAGKKHLILHDVTVEMLLGVLEGELEDLGLLGRSIGTYDSTLKQLCASYGTDAGFCYFGALAANVEYPSRDIVIADSTMHPRTLDRRLKKVLDAGLPLTLARTETPLPPLIIDRKWVMQQANADLSREECLCHENQGDTRDRLLSRSKGNEEMESVVPDISGDPEAKHDL